MSTQQLEKIENMHANTFGNYYLNVIRNSKNSLHSPRTTFNWGYHDAKSDMKAGRPMRDVSAHDDPYYAAGYTQAQQSFTSESSSEITWQLWTATLSNVDYNNTARGILESEILNQEYLFAKKSPRATFHEFTWNDIIAAYDRSMPASSAQQMNEKTSVLRDFGLLG